MIQIKFKRKKAIIKENFWLKTYKNIEDNKEELKKLDKKIEELTDKEKEIDKNIKEFYERFGEILKTEIWVEKKVKKESDGRKKKPTSSTLLSKHVKWQL